MAREPVKKEHRNSVKIDGYFPIKGEDVHGGAQLSNLSPSKYERTAKMFNAAHLMVLDMERRAGSWLKPEKLAGVANTEDGVVFFIPSDKVPALKTLIEEAQKKDLVSAL